VSVGSYLIDGISIATQTNYVTMHTTDQKERPEKKEDSGRDVIAVHCKKLGFQRVDRNHPVFPHSNVADRSLSREPASQIWLKRLGLPLEQ